MCMCLQHNVQAISAYELFFYVHRVVGRPDDWRVDSINLYEEEYFIGREQWAYDDTPSFDYDSDFAK